MNEVYIVDAVRTAIGSFGGTLSCKSSVELGQIVAKAILEKNSLKGEEIDDVIMGNVLQAGQGQNVARQIAIKANIPEDKTAMTINMVCGSGLRAIALADQSIRVGSADLVLAGGVESMSNAPYLLTKARYGYNMGNGTIVDSMVNDGLWDIFNNYHMGVTAENLASKYIISREEQDAFACESQNKAETAIKNGKFEQEIVPITIPQRKGDPIIFKQDEYVRFGATKEALAKLRPAFKEAGTVTAGNSSGINDGAACALLAGKKALDKYKLKPIAKIVSYAYVGVDPSVMGFGPVNAVRKAIANAGWDINDIDLIEANEAFAAQALSVMKELKFNKELVNVNGGSIALGHPIGASGARILTTLLHEMKRRKARKGLVTLCIGGGMGIALCVDTSCLTC